MKASSITFETWNLILSSFPSKLVDFVHYFKYQLSFYTEKLNENPINPNQKIKEVKLVVIIIPSNILTSIQTSFPPNIALKQSRSQCREYRLQWWRWTSVSDVGPVCFLFSCCCWVGYQLNRTGLGWAGCSRLKENIYSVPTVNRKEYREMGRQIIPILEFANCPF